MQCVCAILSSVDCPAVPYFFSHHFIKGTIFEKIVLNIKCVFWFSLQLLSEAILILKKTERDVINNIHLCSYKVPVIHVRC